MYDRDQVTLLIAFLSCNSHYLAAYDLTQSIYPSIHPSRNGACFMFGHCSGAYQVNSCHILTLRLLLLVQQMATEHDMLID